PVSGVAFSLNGQHLFSQDDKGNIQAWETKTGKPVKPIATLPPAAGRVARHPTQPILAMGVKNQVELIDLRLPDPFELGFREGMARFDKHWQTEQANAHENKHNWFAAVFHWGQLAQHAPGTDDYWQKLEAASARLGDGRPALAACDRVLNQDP